MVRQRDGVDYERLEQLSVFLGVVGVGGEPVPALAPREDYTQAGWDFMSFDSRVVRAGLTKFLRPAAPADRLADASWVLVRGLHPGVRLGAAYAVVPLAPERN